MPRTIAQECLDMTEWRQYELTKAIAVAMAESRGSLGAWHDNLDATGKLKSRDCGLYQINIPASQVGTHMEASLRTESLDPLVYLPVMRGNINRALTLYNASWVRNGKPDKRLWQPWVAYTTGWATFPEAWVWLHQDGVPVGPWVPTGRYIHKAIAGQMNHHIVNGTWTAEKGLRVAKEYYCPKFNVDDSGLVIKKGILAWNYPKTPATPPSDGVGPRPIPNNGV